MISNATLARRTKWAVTKETTLQAELISYNYNLRSTFLFLFLVDDYCQSK